MKKRKRWIWFLVVLVIAVVAGKLMLDSRKTVNYAADTAVTGNMTTYLNFSGTVDVSSAVKVVSTGDTTVAEIYVSSGDTVAKNARLMRLNDGTVLKADIAGQITGLKAGAGDAVSTGEELMEIMDLSSMKATFQVDEYDVDAVTPGKDASITVEGTGAEFNAPITALDMRAVQSGDLSYYTATVDLKGVALPPSTLPGMQISVNVLDQHAENAVMLTIDAVSFEADNTPFVYMQDGKNVHKVPVKTGINDGTHVQILSGVNSGETVLYVPTSTANIQTMFQNRTNRITSGVQ